MQVVGQFVAQDFDALRHDVFVGLVGLPRTYFDLRKVGSIDFAGRQVAQFLQHVFPLYGGRRHVGRTVEACRRRKQFSDGSVSERIGVEQHVPLVHQQEQLLIRVYADAL